MQGNLFTEVVPEDRCGVMSEGFMKQCILQRGHSEKLHDMRDVYIEEYWEEEG